MKTLLTWDLAYRLIIVNGYKVNPREDIEYEDKELKDLLTCLSDLDRKAKIIYDSLKHRYAKTKVKLISTIRRSNTQFIGTVEAETETQAISLLCDRFFLKVLHQKQDGENWHEPYLRKLEPTVDKNIWDFHIITDNYT